MRNAKLSASKGRGRHVLFHADPCGRSSDLLVKEIDRLRGVYRQVQQRRPFETIAICVLPDHLHAIWVLPPEDVDFALRWNLIKGNFSRGLSSGNRSLSKIVKREKGIWQ